MIAAAAPRRRIALTIALLALPLCSAMAKDPAWYQKKRTWHETMSASLVAIQADAANQPQGLKWDRWYESKVLKADPIDKAHFPETKGVDLKNAGSRKAPWTRSSYSDGHTHKLKLAVERTIYMYRTVTTREARFDDKQTLVCSVGTYGTNPWGLHDMHGNVSERTLSDFAAYPYDGTDGRNGGDPNTAKVMRGGSWRDRPTWSRSGFRRAYQPWQPVFNGGFRIVIVD